MTHETVAAGMFLPPQSSNDQQLATASQIYPVHSKVAPEDRARVYGHRAQTFLVTGPCAAGKTALALEMEKYFFEARKVVTVLDEENLRSGLCVDLDFSGEGCSEVLRRAAEIAKFLNDSGQVCIAPFIAPEQSMRERFKEIVGNDRCYHIHLATPEDTCRSRDEKGRYQAADRGELRSFPGVGSNYEAPHDADLTLSLAEGEITRCTLLKMSEWLERIGHDFHRKHKTANPLR